MHKNVLQAGNAVVIIPCRAASNNIVLLLIIIGL